MPTYSITWQDDVPVMNAPRPTARETVLLVDRLMRAGRSGVVVSDIVTGEIVSMSDVRQRASEEVITIAPRS